jgi:glyoxylase-like metal-dependent hydrolase (beta-lactamase superfamily II)
MVDTEITDVTDDIVLMRVVGSKFNQGNMTCIALENGLVFVDTGQNAKYSEQFRKAMEKRFNQKTLFVLLTHSHWDHIFGMETFHDVPIISSEKGVDSIREELAKELSPEGRQKVIEQSKKWLEENKVEITKERQEWFDMLPKVKVSIPTIGIREEMIFHSDGKEFLYRVVGGHSECSSYIHCVSDEVLITGDNLVAKHAANSGCMLAGFGSQGLEVLSQFEKMGVDKYVPGHGPVVNTDYIVKSRKWFSSMFDALRGLKRDGVSAEDAIKDSSLPEFFESETPRSWDMIVEHWYNTI